MKPEKILLNAYFETLYNTLLEQKQDVYSQIDQLLKPEIEKLETVSPERIDAYREACIAFVDERLEMYNPIGLQYTFDNQARKFAKELELQLNWFDSTEEFNKLLEAIKEIANKGFDEKNVEQYAKQLISQFGAFPDKSIIESFREKPALQKIPDYVVACSIEKIIEKVVS
jgi:hypothetical protein